MPKFLIFTRNTALILSNPDNYSELLEYPNVIPDPDLSRVEKIQPHFWKMSNNDVIPMSEEERQVRMKDILDNGVIKDIEPIFEFNLKAPEVIVEKKEEPNVIFLKDHIPLKSYYLMAGVALGILVVQLLFLFAKK